MKKEITIDYIRAFFDGEGCIHINKCSSNSLLESTGTIDISNTVSEIIYLISQKLTELGIKNIVIKRERIKKNHKDIFVIKITDIANIYNFYKIVGTFLDVKDKKFKMLLKDNERIRRYKIIPKICKLAKSGLSYKQIGKIVGVSPSSICHIINKKFYCSHSISVLN